ncbi:hypothetical protein CHELA1G11_13019 [Hyphomicrobiales bacterium]|nr:hypothetical protein CHELA1G2_11291 [Hyphomicrobiales bacterium]CAH1668736.1 hypothetical protein CHELA1G11_13019 [Hyphomicrobiales bacterium]
MNRHSIHAQIQAVDFAIDRVNDHAKHLNNRKSEIALIKDMLLSARKTLCDVRDTGPSIQSGEAGK